MFITFFIFSSHTVKLGQMWHNLKYNKINSYMALHFEERFYAIKNMQSIVDLYMLHAQ